MELRDVIVTPLVIGFFYVIAYTVRRSVTDQQTRGYFMPAFTVRIIGALSLGFLYQFYYGGGDTFNFHTHGSRHLWEAVMDSPASGLQLIFGDASSVTGVYKYTSKIPFFYDKSSFTIIRIAAFFDLFTFSSYAATAVCFSVVSFIGSWMLFQTFYYEKRDLLRWIAIATLFVPSVFFWGSGLLKDTVTLAAVGAATYGVHQIFILKRPGVGKIVMLIFAVLLLFYIKKYILICYLPSALLWVSLRTISNVKTFAVRMLILPVVLAIAVASAVFAVQQVAKDDQRYEISKLGETAKITAYDIAYQTGREAGSTYSIGELDGSFANLVQLSPQAIIVSLFRPYLWEVRNPLMLFSALESVVLLVLTIYVVWRSFRYIGKILSNPDIVFCLLFSITFAFAVGVSTFNFGTLSRYKIPLLPFYLIALIFILHEANKARKLVVLDKTE